MPWPWNDDEEEPFGFGPTTQYGFGPEPYGMFEEQQPGQNRDNTLQSPFMDLDFGQPNQEETPSPQVNPGGRGFALPNMPQYDSSFEDAYYNYLNSAPKREDHKAGKLQKLGAILGGVSSGYFAKDPYRGFQTTRAMLDAPYQDAVQDWKLQGTGKEANAKREQTRYDREMGRYIQGLNAKRQNEDSESKRLNDAENRDYRRALTESVKNPQDWTVTEIGGRAVLWNRKNPSEMFDQGEGTRLTRSELLGEKKADRGASMSRVVTGARLRSQADKESDERTFGYNKEMEGIRQKGQMNMLGEREKNFRARPPKPRELTPGQQAESDTINMTREYMNNSSKYQKLLNRGLKIDQGYVVVDPLTINKATPEELELIRELTGGNFGSNNGVIQNRTNNSRFRRVQ